jgi:hypothetical protein
LAVAFQLLQAVNTQAARAQQAKMLALKKKEGTGTPDETGTVARPGSPSSSQVGFGLVDLLLMDSCGFSSTMHDHKQKLKLVQFIQVFSQMSGTACQR